MALGGIYNTGTVTATNGSPTVVGDGVIWSDVIEGDFIQVGTSVALISRVDSGFSEWTLMSDWAGPTQVAADYTILKMSWQRYDPSLTQKLVREMLAKISDAGVFYSVAGTDPDPEIGNDGDYAIKVNTTRWVIWNK